MPTDYLKILSKNKDFAERLYNDPLLDIYSIGQRFSNRLSEDSNVIKQATHVKCYKEILFCFFTKNEEFTKLEILIKPHYYFNDNVHNANDFSVLNCIKILTEIKEVFDLPVKELIVLNIEFGVNFIGPINSTDLISYTIYHEKNEFINSSDNLRFSKISFKHHKDGKANKYKQIKFYAKGLQFSEYTDINTSRFEVKSKERKYIKTLGVKTYEDLLDFETYKNLAEEIKKEFNNVLILDIGNNRQNLTDKELSRLNECLNTYKWVKSLQGSRNLFSRHKTDYFKLLDKTGENIHSKVFSVIENKLKELLKPCAISTPQNTVKRCAISDVYIIGNCTQKRKRICPITGIDLRHEKDDANYIRTTTINYLKRNDTALYRMLCSMFISSKGKRPKYESGIISHICKNIRNKYYNRRIIKQTGYKTKLYQNQLSLDI